MKIGFDNKRGLVTIGIILYIFMVFTWVIIIGIYLIIFNLTTENLAIDIDIGQVNLKDTVDNTMGKFNDSFTASADLFGFIVIFGMMINMFMSAFLFRGKYPRLFMIVDIIILVFAYILAVYISQSYDLLINASSVLDVYSNDMQRTSTFILNLPKFVALMGAIVMILSYAAFPRDTEAEIVVGQIQ